eukprot:gene3781-biopygen17277
MGSSPNRKVTSHVLYRSSHDISRSIHAALPWVKREPTRTGRGPHNRTQGKYADRTRAGHGQPCFSLPSVAPATRLRAWHPPAWQARRPTDEAPRRPGAADRRRRYCRACSTGVATRCAAPPTREVRTAELEARWAARGGGGQVQAGSTRHSGGIDKLERCDLAALSPAMGAHADQPWFCHLRKLRSGRG